MAALSLGFYACQNSLGYDPNVNVTKISTGGTDNPGDTTKPVTVFRADSVRMAFKESIRMPMDASLDMLWPETVVTKRIKLDTSTTDTKIWMELGVENRNPDNEHRRMGINERVTKFELYFEGSIKDNEPVYPLDDAIKAKNWFQITTKYMPQNTTNNYNGSQIRSDLVLVNNDREKGILRLLLNVSVTDKRLTTRITKFNGTIIIFYKK